MFMSGGPLVDQTDVIHYATIEHYHWHSHWYMIDSDSISLITAAVADGIVTSFYDIK